MLSHKREAERGDVNTEAEIAGSHQKLEEDRYKFPQKGLDGGGLVRL